MTERAIEALQSILRQLGELIENLGDHPYVSKPVGVVKSSIGGHVRHCLDHVESLLNAIETGQLNYDERKRGTEVESNRQAALDTIRSQEQRLADLEYLPADLPLSIAMLVTPETAIEAPTSLGRELAFVLSHTIHHNSLVGVMAALLGVQTPPRFGYAPSTIAHQERAVCSR